MTATFVCLDCGEVRIAGEFHACAQSVERARLASLAPELLAELEKANAMLVKWWHHGIDWQEHQRCHSSITALIAKARGK